ncbi:hypothetical protein TVAG_043940 [Trichomonas vaginalis G3]|uniref:Uncharacterized protein n=1 Tax=Trichomonas vaginalis (strain ATCC PRA-98 / G3) TaxID=412133 RepID=A2E0F4_TRIV3|nr:hypothetical protein TVAGG3_0541000 [Trichomonas vaginalis G3]EAY13834.1 hypothetical protein TVAG_043940 [Trichomonas vaginalis G3]KAI5519839.1 hypothetical protein TVAGG3_0541000 [Trichomonas vaginalis G3]|eukprot:XP_001326057.1 hypothetical protein [Trichomonas vaginalis G3]
MFPDSVNSLSNNKSTPLHFAVSANDYQMVLCLLMNKANPNLVNNLGQSPLHLSIVSTEQKIFKALVAFHADLHIKDNSGRTPSNIAIHRELAQMYKILTSYSDGSNIPSEEDVIADFIEEDQYSDVEEDEEIPRNPSEELDVIEEKVKNLENALKQNK